MSASKLRWPLNACALRCRRRPQALISGDAHAALVPGVQMVLDWRPWEHCSAAALARLFLAVRAARRHPLETAVLAFMRPADIQRAAMWAPDDCAAVLLSALEAGALYPLKEVRGRAPRVLPVAGPCDTPRRDASRSAAEIVCWRR